MNYYEGRERERRDAEEDFYIDRTAKLESESPDWGEYAERTGTVHTGDSPTFLEPED